MYLKGVLLVMLTIINFIMFHKIIIIVYQLKQVIVSIFKFTIIKIFYENHILLKCS